MYEQVAKIESMTMDMRGGKEEVALAQKQTQSAKSVRLERNSNIVKRYPRLATSVL